MEINIKNQTDMVDTYVNQVQAKPKSGDAAEKDIRQQSITADTVVISETAKRIQEARFQIESIPDTRSEKVAEIKRSIQDGTYKIEPDKIADKMIRESLLNDLFK